MASIKKRGKKWIVRWRDPDGVQRTRTCPDAETARQLGRDVDRTRALGARWEPADARALPALLELGQDEHGRTVATGGLVGDFLAAKRGRLSAGTRRHYDRALRDFLVWLAERHPQRRRLSCDLLTRDALESWFGSLIDDRGTTCRRCGRELGEHDHRGRHAFQSSLGLSAARLYVSAVWSAWSWAYDSDAYGSVVARPRRPDLPAVVQTPAAAPTWAHMDAAIGAAWRLAAEARTTTDREAYAWRARLCTLLRFTGLRVDEQALRLRWSDVDWERGSLVVRGELGKSARERAGREIPLAPQLLELMKGWPRGDWLIAPELGAARRSRSTPYRHSDPRRMARIWEAARVTLADGRHEPVPGRVWGQGPGRRKAQVHHAFRKGFKTGLSALGVASDVRDYLVGHHRGIDEHYLDTWEQAVAAVRRLPPLSPDAALVEAAVAEVVRFPGAR